MDDIKANLVITDPPYNVNYEGSAGKIKNDNMAGEKFYEFLLAAFEKYGVGHGGGRIHLCVFMPTPRA